MTRVYVRLIACKLHPINGQDLHKSGKSVFSEKQEAL